MPSNIKALFIIAILLLAGACTSPDERAAEYVASGNRLMASGDMSKASLEFRNALQIDANLVDALYGMALIEERNQNWKPLFAILTRIRELDARHSAARIKLAQLLLASGQLDIALQDAQELIEAFPLDAGTHALLAATYYRLNNVDEAYRKVNEALAIDPANRDAKLVLARIQIGRSNVPRAIAILDEMIAADSFDLSPYLMKIRAYEQSGNSSGIAVTLQDMIAVYPHKRQFKESLAQLYVTQGELQKAEQLYRDASDSSDSSTADKLRLVSFLYRNVSTQKGIATLEGYIRENPRKYDLQFALARILEREGNRDAARDIYQVIVATEGVAEAGLQARTRMAEIAMLDGDFAQAEKLVAEVISTDRLNSNALMIRASLALNSNDPQSAIGDLRTVLRDWPESVRALALLGRAHEIARNNDLAHSNYRKAFRLDPSSSAIANSYASLLARDNRTAIAAGVLEESMARGNRAVETIRLLAQLKISLQEFDDAEVLAGELENIQGEEAHSYQLQGLILQKKKRFEESIGAFRKAHEVAPHNARPVVALVKVYVLTGEFDKANSFLRSILKLDPGNPLAHHLLVQVALAQNRLAEAEVAAQQLLEINPDLEIAYRNLALIRSRQARYAEAEEVLGSGLERLGDSYTLSLMLASILETRGKYEEAIDLYRDIHARHPVASIVKNNLASLLVDIDKSEAGLKEAVDLSREFKHSRIPHFRDTYAWALLNSGGDPGAVIAILEEVVDEVGTNSVFRYHLAVAYLRNGDNANAERHLRRAIEYSGSDHRLKTKVEKMLNEMNA